MVVWQTATLPTEKPWQHTVSQACTEIFGLKADTAHEYASMAEDS